MELKKLLIGLEGLKVKGNLDLDINGIEKNSKDVKEGFLFVAIKGFAVDGHKFIDQVMKQGALATLSERPLGEVDFPYIQVESSLQAVKDLAAYYLEQLQIPVVGITVSFFNERACIR